MPVLPVQTRSEILHFVQNDHGEALITGEDLIPGEGDDYRGEMTIEVPVILSVAKNLDLCAGVRRGRADWPHMY